MNIYFATTAGKQEFFNQIPTTPAAAFAEISMMTAAPGTPMQLLVSVPHSQAEGRETQVVEPPGNETEEARPSPRINIFNHLTTTQ